MTSALDQDFKRNYEAHLKHLRLKGLQPKTIEAYARAIRRIGGYFDHRIDDLSEQQSIQNVLSTSPRAETSSLPPAPKKNTVLQPLRAGKTQKAIFITSRTLTQAGLVQQTVQIVARFAHTI